MIAEKPTKSPKTKLPFIILFPLWLHPENKNIHMTLTGNLSPIRLYLFSKDNTCKGMTIAAMPHLAKTLK